MNKKTILIESQYLLNYNEPEKGLTVGGSQRYTIELANLFKDMGYKIIIITKAKKNFSLNYLNIAKIIALKAPYGNKGNVIFSKLVY